MAEREDTRCETDGEEARPRGLSIFTHGWNLEAGRKWGEAFVASELRRLQSVKHSLRNKKLLEALRQEINATAYCVYCGGERRRVGETPQDWILFDSCPECRKKRIRARDITHKHCRYCNATYTRDEVLGRGGTPQTWGSGNKCINCTNAYKQIVDLVKQLVRERLRSGDIKPTDHR